MALDIRQRRPRHATGRFESEAPRFAKRGICFGGLTPGIALPVGSAIGQVSQAQPASTNLLFNTYAPQIAPWVANGGAALVALSQNDQWDANFITGIFAGGAPTDFLNNPTIVTLTNSNCSVSAQFSSAGNSTAARFGVNWTGGVARFDFIDINPKTGQIIAASPGVQQAFVSTYQSRNQSNQIVTIVAASFSTTGLPVGTNAGDFRLFPALTGGAVNVFAGGFQVEQIIPPTAFIPTPLNGTATRAFATTTRLTTDRTEPPATLTASYAYQPVLDNGRVFNISGAGVVFTLPNGVGQANPGEWVDIYYSGTTSFQLAIGGIGAIQGPGIASAGVAAINFPYDGATPAGNVGPFNVCGIRAICLTPLTWKFQAIAEARGKQLFTSNGTFNARQGMTTIWVDGSAAGGGGGGCAANAANGSAGGGGGAGQATKDQAIVTVPGTSYSVTLGVGGTGGPAGANNGTAGGNTTIGALVTLTGGGLGTGAATGATGTGGAAGGANAVAGDPGQIIAGTLSLGGHGGQSLFGQFNPAVFSIGAGSNAGQVQSGFGTGGPGGSSGATGAAAAGANGRPGFASITW